MKINWEDSFVFYLIEKVHNAEFIWNDKHTHYKNKFQRQIFWTKMVKEMNEEFRPSEPFTYEQINKKWNNLKSYYAAENIRVCRAQKSGASAEEVENIKTSWKYNSRLQFLSSVVESTPSVDNFNKRCLKRRGKSSNDCASDSLPYLASGYAESIYANIKKSPSSSEYTVDSNQSISFSRRTPVTNTSIEPAHHVLPQVQEKLNTSKDDDCDIYGENIACEIRGISDEDRIYVKKIINDAIFEAKVGRAKRMRLVLENEQQMDPLFTGRTMEISFPSTAPKQ